MPPITARDAITRSALRKASLRLIPLIAFGYCAAYMDRVNISFAALQMNRDLHFSNTVYGLGAGLFFLSYAAFEIPSNLLLYRIGARRWLARIMVTWGFLAMGMLFVRTPTHFYVMRLLLGIAEAGFFPGVIFYLMQWFPPELRARTISRFYISLPLSSVIMGAIAGALLNLQGKLGLAGWQWLFLAEGIPPVILGVVFFFALPDSPAQASWLTPAEREAILSAVAEEASEGGSGGHTDSIGPALRDPRVLLLSLFFFCMLASSYAYTFSAPALLQQVTGLATERVGYVIALMSLLGAASMLLNAAFSDGRRDPTASRISHIFPGCALLIVSFAACGLSASPLVVVPALLGMILGYNSMQGPLWAMPAAFLKGRSAAAGIAAMNMIGMIGGFAGPYWMGFARDRTGAYRLGLTGMAFVMLLATGLLFMLRVLLLRSQMRPDAQPMVISASPAPLDTL